MIGKNSAACKKTGMKFLDLGIIVVYIIVTSVFILFHPFNESVFRPVLGFPLVFFVPGYVLVSALFPTQTELDPYEHIALSIGLSICIAIFTGFFLNYTSYGIRVPSIVFSLSAITLVLTAVCAIRRISPPKNNPDSDNSLKHL
jgi:uncharacterized membrane protein